MKMMNGHISEDGRIDVEDWNSYIKVPVRRLYISVFEILKLRDNILKSLNGDIIDLVDKSANIKKILLGGIDENGEYGEYSLAKIYKDLLGISIAPKNFIFPDVDIKCEICDTDFLQYIRRIIDCSEKIICDYHDTGEYTQVVTSEVILENPKLIKRLLADIYQLSKQISANVNDHTFFILNTRCIPRYYIENIYPKIKDRFDDLSNIIDLEHIYIPEIDNDEKRNNYTLWGHKKGGFADSIYTLNRIIWNMLASLRLRYTFSHFMPEAENLFLAYEDKIGVALLRMSWDWPIYEMPEHDSELRIDLEEMCERFGRLVDRSGDGPYWSMVCNINGERIVESYLSPSWKNKKIRPIRLNSHYIIELFDEISPALFLGKIRLRDDYKDMDKLDIESYCPKIFINKNQLVIGPMFKGA